MIIYLIKSSLCLLIFLILYYLVLERENMPIFKRFYLLFSLAFSFVMPFIIINFESESTSFLANTSTLQTFVLPTIEVVTTTNYRPQILYTLFGIITSIFVIRFILNLRKISKTRQNAELIKYQDAEIALVDSEIAPHTFGNTIFINKKEYESNLIENVVYLHELTHVRQKHTLDVLLIEALKTIFWFNPLLILYKKAIQLNHEFLADQKVISTEDNINTYQNILLSNIYKPSNLYLSSNLNSFLKTKKRFIMMTKTSSKSKALLTKLSVIPVIALLTMISCTNSDMNPEAGSAKIKKAVEVKAVAEGEKPSNPTFEGGMPAFYKFFGEEFSVPTDFKGEGKLIVGFVVKPDGNLDQISIIRDAGHGTGEEAMRVLKMSPKWNPGELYGKPVNVMYYLPITVTGS